LGWTCRTGSSSGMALFDPTVTNPTKTKLVESALLALEI
jgi:hypothetical protein